MPPMDAMPIIGLVELVPAGLVPAESAAVDMGIVVWHIPFPNAAIWGIMPPAGITPGVPCIMRAFWFWRTAASGWPERVAAADAVAIAEVSVSISTRNRGL